MQFCICHGLKTDIIQRSKNYIHLCTRFFNDGFFSLQHLGTDLMKSSKLLFSHWQFTLMCLIVSSEISGGLIHYEVYSMPDQALHSIGLFTSGIISLCWLFSAWMIPGWKQSCPGDQHTCWTKCDRRIIDAIFKLFNTSGRWLWITFPLSWAYLGLLRKGTIPKLLPVNVFGRKGVWSVPYSLGLRFLFRQSELN